MDENTTDLVGKEFIFEYGVDRILPPSDKTGGVFATEQRAYRRERIVRCRDCRRSFEDRGYLWCCGIVGPPIEPEGFCAWGEERRR